MKDCEIIKEIASRYADIAFSDANSETLKRYKDLNGLRPVRPVVMIGEIPWSEFSHLPELVPQCESPDARRLEMFMRKKLFQYDHFRGDMYFEPYYPMLRPFEIESMGIEEVEKTLSTDVNNHIKSHEYTDQLKDEDDLRKLHTPKVIWYKDQEESSFENCSELLKDIMPVKPVGKEFHFHPWDIISRWRGVSELLMSLYDDPEFCHAIMRRLTDIHLDILGQLENLGLLRNNGPVLHSTAAACDELDEDGPCHRSNMWGRGTAQIFGEVSPAMHEEFDITYQQEFMKDFGLVYYGCCEPLHTKIDIVEKIPHLRKISITPWADVDIAADCMGSRYVMSRKPNPAYVAMSIDDDVIRDETRRTLDACRRNGTVCEFVLKDISTVSGKVENLTRWNEIVQDTIDRYY